MAALTQAGVTFGDGTIQTTATTAANLSAKVSKTGDTMSGNLTIANTAPTLVLSDTDGGVTKQVHHNGDLIGFLGNQGQWIQYVNNSGQLWTGNYGWLHDRFASASTTLTQGTRRESQAAIGDGINPGGFATLGYEVFNAGGGSHQVRAYGYRNTNCNCDCNCACCG